MKTTGFFAARLITGTFVVNLFLYLLVGPSLYEIRQQYIIQTELSTQNLAQSIEGHVLEIIDKIDIALSTVEWEAERQLNAGGIQEKTLNEYIRRQQERVPVLQVIRMTNDIGDVRYGTDMPHGKPLNVADRNAFRHLKDNPKAGLVIAIPT